MLLFKIKYGIHANVCHLVQYQYICAFIVQIWLPFALEWISVLKISRMFFVFYNSVHPVLIVLE